MYRKKPTLSFLLFLSLAVILSGVSLAADVDIHPDDGTSIGSIPEAIPTASNLGITGTARVGAILTERYTFHSATGHTESGTTIAWQSSSSANGTFTPITGAAGVNYTITSADVGKYIRFAVTPKTATKEGVTSFSAPVGPIAANVTPPPPPPTTTPTPTPTPAPSPTPAVEDSTITVIPEVTGGTAAATADETLIEEAIAGGGAAVVIVMAPDEDISEISLMLSANVVDMLVGAETPFAVSTPIANIAFDLDALNAMFHAVESGEVVISASCADTSGLSEESMSIIGEYPVYHLSVSVDGVPIPDFGGGYANVTLPYTLRGDESEDQLIIYYIDADGELTIIRNCTYNADTQTVSFVTDHFSTYAISYNAVRFTDVTGDWYKPAVDFVSSRGIFVGSGNGIFSPGGTMTRGMFAKALANFDGVDLSVYTDSPFTDVDINEWYGECVAWAYESGIVNGVGGGRFSPNSSITREQMATMLFNYMNFKGIVLPSVNEGEFSDMGDVHDWALDAVTSMRASGIIQGAGNNNFVPGNTANRASVATIFTNFIKLFVTFKNVNY